MLRFMGSQRVGHDQTELNGARCHDLSFVLFFLNSLKHIFLIVHSLQST